MLIRPKQLAKGGSEHAHQCALFAWASVARLHGFAIADAWADGGPVPALDGEALPVLAWYYATPNGGSRGDSLTSRKIEGGRMRAEGVRPGVPDTFLPVPRHGCHGLYIELKKIGKRANVSPDQKRAIDFLRDQGYAVAVCEGWREAANCLRQYLE